MKNLIFLIISLIFVSCGKKQITQFKIDPQLKPYYDNMVANGKKYGRNLNTNDLILKLGSTGEPNVLGYCQTYTQTSWNFFTEEVVSTPLVVISKEHFLQMGEVGRREIISHELGHCLMNKPHDERVSPNGYAESIMYPYFINESIYEAYETSYLEQLFGVRSLAFTDNGNNGVTSLVALNSNEKKAFTAYHGVKVTTHYFLKDGCEKEKDLHDNLEEAKEFHSTEDVINEDSEE